MRLMGKFQLKNTAQLTHYAIQHESDMTMPIPAQPEPRPLIAQDAMRMVPPVTSEPGAQGVAGVRESGKVDESG
jgi:hypothetical protein